MAESDCIVATGDRIFRRSHILALRSSDPEMIFSSLDVNTADVTVSWWPWNTETEWIVSRKSHNRNVESLEDVTTSRWLGCAAVCVSSSSWPASWKWISTDPILDILSCLMIILSSHYFSIFYSIIYTWCRSWPVWVSHMQASLSQPAVTACSPPGSQSAAITTPWCPVKDLSGVLSTEHSSTSSLISFSKLEFCEFKLFSRFSFSP